MSPNGGKMIFSWELQASYSPGLSFHIGEYVGETEEEEIPSKAIIHVYIGVFFPCSENQY